MYVEAVRQRTTGRDIGHRVDVQGMAEVRSRIGDTREEGTGARRTETTNYSAISAAFLCV